MEASDFGPIFDGQRSRTGLIRIWIFGFLLSFLLIWGFTAFTLDQPTPFIWDKESERYVVKPGTYLCAVEGFATTEFGRFGISGLTDASKTIAEADGNWIAVWGDSYVEAMQVPDKMKMPQVASQLWKEQGKRHPLAFVGIGMGGWTLADIYFQIPKYEKLLGKPKAHIIVISEIVEFDPNHREREAYFTDEPEFHFEPSKWKPPHQDLKMELSKLRMGFLWEILRGMKDNVGLRFSVGPVPKQELRRVAKRKADPAAVRYLVTQLKHQTDRPVGFLVLNRVPRLKNGKLLLDGPFELALQVIKPTCDELNAPLQTTQKTFNEFAKTTKRFPKGFWTRSAGGHLNRNGHRLAAGHLLKLADELISRNSDMETMNALHAD